MKQQKTQQSISALAALLMFGVFAVGILSVLLGGADSYRRLTQRDRVSYDERTCAQYMATKLRQAPSPESVVLSSFGDGDALLISQQVGQAEYCTRVYCHDGYLIELFAASGGEFAPEDGERLLPAQGLSLRRAGGLLYVELTDGNGQEVSLVLSLRGGEGAGQ